MVSHLLPSCAADEHVLALYLEATFISLAFGTLGYTASKISDRPTHVMLP